MDHSDGGRSQIEDFQTLLASHGITGVKIANTMPGALAALADYDRRYGLTLWVTASLKTPYGPRDTPLDLALLVAQREANRTPRLNPNAVKMFMDGVPTSARTAAMRTAYARDAGHPAFVEGDAHLKLDRLADDLTRLDRAGFVVKIHTAGDAAVTTTLDAIARVRAANGPGGGRFELAHAGYVDPADYPRFKALNVSPDFSPYIWFPSGIIQSIVKATGPRGHFYWPTRDLIAADAPIVIGSDWPAAVASPNPWVGIEALVTRRDPFGKFPGALWPEQAIPLETALALVTRSNASALALPPNTGAIEPGGSADLIVLDRHLFRIAPDAIGDTRVLLTLFAGRAVHAEGPFTVMARTPRKGRRR